MENIFRLLPTVYPYMLPTVSLCLPRYNIYDLHGVYTTTPTVYRHSHSVNCVVHGIYTLHGIYLNGCGYTVDDNFPTVYIRSPRYIIYRGEHLQCSPTVYPYGISLCPTVYSHGIWPQIYRGSITWEAGIYTVGNIYRGYHNYTPWDNLGLTMDHPSNDSSWPPIRVSSQII